MAPKGASENNDIGTAPWSNLGLSIEDLGRLGHVHSQRQQFQMLAEAGHNGQCR